MRLLLVEDDVELAGVLSRGLTQSDHDVRVARDGRDALFLIGEEPFDVVILERRLPLLDGLAVLKRIRNEKIFVPVLMLSAHGDVSDKVEGLDAGADDYLVKPVELAELNARVRALARRPAQLVETGILRTRTVELNLLQRKVRRGDRMIDLPPLEFKILVELIRNSDKVVTRRMLLKSVWGYDVEPATNIVVAQIARIRAALNFGKHLDIIRTVRGAGYMISSDV